MTNQAEEFVILARLDSAHGFFSFGDILDLTGQLQGKGINAVAEKAPSALADLPDAYFIKVPIDQLAWAKDVYIEIMRK